MKIAKTIEAVVGVAVGGSLMLMLSGGAFAADSSMGPTPQVPTQSGLSDSPKAGNTNTIGASSSGGVVDVTVTSSNDKTMAAVTPVVSGGDGGATTETKPAAASVAGSEVPASSSKTKIETAGTEPVVPVSTHDEAAVTPVVAPAVKSETAAAGPQAGAVAFETIVINSTVLPVQPKITTTHVAAIEDLAASVPSAPANHSHPSTPAEPSQSSGLLSRLSAGLAGSVVPPVFLTPAFGLAGLVIELASLLILTLLTLGRLALTFGAFVRRGGYAHAARSDVAEAARNTIFATPLVMSYVPAFVPRHSSFLVVSETKTVRLMDSNAFRKEEMR